MCIKNQGCITMPAFLCPRYLLAIQGMKRHNNILTVRIAPDLSGCHSHIPPAKSAGAQKNKKKIEYKLM